MKKPGCLRSRGLLSDPPCAGYRELTVPWRAPRYSATPAVDGFMPALREQPWRQKVLRFYDLDFHIIEIGESMEHTCFRLHLEGLNDEEISKTCLMPLPFVQAAIEKYKA